MGNEMSLNEALQQGLKSEAAIVTTGLSEKLWEERV
jgi:hypothetical protein